MAVDVARRPGATEPRRGSASSRAGLWVITGLAGIAILVRLFDPEQFAWVRNFLIVFGSLLVEAMPFIVLGAFVSAAIEVFVPASAFEKIARLPRGLQIPAAAASGMAFPVCECGSVPVARRLAAKGLAPSAAVTFMLAAPIVNPVVVASTYVAYRGRDTVAIMVLGRLALGFIVAMAVGWVLGAVRGRPAAEAARCRGRGARGRRGRAAVATVLRTPHGRHRVHGQVPHPRRGDRRCGADLHPDSRS